jgi:hypothetical protein
MTSRNKRTSTKLASEFAVVETVIFVAPTGGRWNGKILVGFPKRVRGRKSWFCAAFAERIADKQIAGATKLQAVMLAMQHLAIALFAFESSGGQIMSRQGARLPGLDIFGRLWCNAEGLRDFHATNVDPHT